MNRENSNMNALILVFIRPADSLYSLISAYLQRQGYAFSFCSSIYEVIRVLAETPEDTTTLLIVRPAMLSDKAANQLYRHFRKLWVIGWLDSDDQLSDLTFQQSVSGSTVMLNHLNQFRRTIELLTTPSKETLPENQSLLRSNAGNDERLRYDLSNDEIDALLGVQ